MTSKLLHPGTFGWVLLGVAVACRTPPSKDSEAAGETAGPERRCADLPWKKVAVGYAAVCGIHTDGCLECWGNEGISPPIEEPCYGTIYEGCEWTWDYGDAEPPEGTFIDIAMSPGYPDLAGTFHACGLRDDGEVVCWGRNELGQASPPEGTYASVITGGSDSCALDSNGHADCWGGYVGHEVEFGDVELVQLDASETTYCGVTRTGAIICDDGSSGTDEISADEMPEAGVSKVVLGRYRECYIDTAGMVGCWYWRSSIDVTINHPVQDLVLRGSSMICALYQTGAIECWGEVYGSGPPEEGIYEEISGLNSSFCAVDLQGRMHCWGEGGWGQQNIPGSFVLP